MAKWADYLISAVSYINTGKGKHINKVKVHKDNDESVGGSEIWTRDNVISYIDKGYTFCTIIRTRDEKWSKGAKVEKVWINNDYYLRTDANKKEEDNLENLPEF